MPKKSGEDPQHEFVEAEPNDADQSKEDELNPGVAQNVMVEDPEDAEYIDNDKANPERDRTRYQVGNAENAGQYIE